MGAKILKSHLWLRQIRRSADNSVCRSPFISNAEACQSRQVDTATESLEFYYFICLNYNVSIVTLNCIYLDNKKEIVRNLLGLVVDIDSRNLRPNILIS